MRHCTPAQTLPAAAGHAVKLWRTRLVCGEAARNSIAGDSFQTAGSSAEHSWRAAAIVRLVNLTAPTSASGSIVSTYDGVGAMRSC